MPTFQGKSGSISFQDLGSQSRSFRDGYSETIKLYQQADSADLLSVMGHYRLELDAYNKKIHCPFKFHHDRTASFYYYPETNTFYCWGCKSSGGPSNFVSLIENISKFDAAKKIIANFNIQEDLIPGTNISEWRELYQSFSVDIRSFIQNNKSDQTALNFAHTITFMFDQITQNHTLDLMGLQHILKKLTKRLKEFE
jgi:DNA primase